MFRWTRVALVLLLLFLFVQILIFSPKDLDSLLGEDKKPDVVATTPTAEQKMGGVHLTESRGGERDWELFAKGAEGYEGKSVWALMDMKVVFYSEKGVTFTVTGEKGNIEISSKNMNISGNVVMHSSNGYHFRSESMSYDAKTRTIKAPTTIKMEGPKQDGEADMQVEGDSMVTNLADNKMTVTGSVKTRKNVKDKKMLILSQKAEFSAANNSARFSGDVEIEVNSMKIVGPDAEFRYEKDTNLLESVFVDGGVRVSDLDKWATSENVSVDFKGDQFVFRGAPRVVQNQDELVGEEIVFLEGGKKVRVKSAKSRFDESVLKEEKK